MDKIQERLVRGSRRLAFAFTVLFWIGALWLLSETAWRPLKEVAAVFPSGRTVDAMLGLIRALLAETPAFALMGALWTARGLFRRFARGEALTIASGRSLSIIGCWFLASALASGTFSSAPSSRPTAAFAEPPTISAEIVLGCVGAALILLGRAFSAAAAIKADHDQIV
jgi:hypothetical protein